MADTPPNGETASQGTVSNDVSQGSAPTQVNATPAEVEQARKEADQARMRAAQLENELKALRDKEAQAETKRLQENEEWKTIAEKREAELNELRQQQESQARQSQLSAATDEVFKDYPASVTDIAKTTGLSLTDDSEAARASLKEKLDAISSKIGSSAPTVTANNPSNPAASSKDYRDLTTPSADDGRRSWNPSPMAMASAQGNTKQVFHEYAESHPAVSNTLKEMKRQAGIKVD